MDLKLSAFLATVGAKFWAATYKIPLKESIPHIASYGYGGVEIMPKDPRKIDAKKLNGMIKANSLEPVTIASGLVYVQHGLSFSSPRDDIRREAVKRINDCIKFAQDLDANIVIIGLVRGKLEPTVSKDQAEKNVTGCLRECGEYARDLGVTLVVEPINRYETDIFNTVDETLRLIEDVDLSSVKIMVDTFHMNIEEASIVESIKKASDKLVHVHIADSNRCAPGMGHINFAEIIETLKEIGYDGYLGVEVLPKPDSDTAAKRSIEYLKKLL